MTKTIQITIVEDETCELINEIHLPKFPSVWFVGKAMQIADMETKKLREGTIVSTMITVDNTGTRAEVRLREVRGA